MLDVLLNPLCLAGRRVFFTYQGFRAKLEVSSISLCRFSDAALVECAWSSAFSSSPSLNLQPGVLDQDKPLCEGVRVYLQ